MPKKTHKSKERRTSPRLKGEDPENRGLTYLSKKSKNGGGFFGYSFPTYSVVSTRGMKTPKHRTRKLQPSRSPKTPEAKGQEYNGKYRKTPNGQHKLVHVFSYRNGLWELYVSEEEASKFVEQKNRVAQRTNVCIPGGQQALFEAFPHIPVIHSGQTIKKVTFTVPPKFNTKAKPDRKSAMGGYCAHQLATFLGYQDTKQGLNNSSSFHYTHLQADRFNGKCNPENLVVTTFACNYQIGQLEEAIDLFNQQCIKNGKSALQCEVICYLETFDDDINFEKFVTHKGKTIEYIVKYEGRKLLEETFDCNTLGLLPTFTCNFYRADLKRRMEELERPSLLFCSEELPSPMSVFGR